MKIALVGPGIMSIPPKGWGAVEILIWDYYRFLTALGHEIIVINTKDQEKIIHNINIGNFDFVHIHYDVFVDIIPKLKTKVVAITSHYPFIETRPDKNYQVIFEKMIEYTNLEMCYIFSLNMKDLLSFVKAGCNKDRILLSKNGVSEDIRLRKKAKYNKSIYLAKIEPRKRQYLTNDIDNIDYYGPIAAGYQTPNNYCGEMSRKDIFQKLTRYTNLILLSESESNPLVVMEAMMAGLGVVLSENCGCEENEFITIIEEKRINDKDYIQKKIEENKIKSRGRNHIRQFAIDSFSWKIVIDKYIKNINYINEING